MSAPQAVPALGVYSADQVAMLTAKEQRIRQITRDLQFDPHTPYRRELVREFLDLTNPEPNHV